MTNSIVRDTQGRFASGHSGNPDGRPPVLQDVRALAREHTATAISTLAGIMNDQSETGQTRIAAGIALLDRGYGRPGQFVELVASLPESLDGSLNDLTLEELATLRSIAQARQLRASATAGPLLQIEAPEGPQ